MLSSFSLKSGVFERFWRILCSPFTVLYIRRKTEDPCFERAPVRFFFPKSHRSAFKLCRKKVERYTLLFVPLDQKSIQKARSQPSKKIKIPQFLKGQNASQDSYMQVTNRPADILFFYFLFFIFIIRNSKQRTQYSSKLLKNSLLRQKWRQYATGKVLQRLFNID